MPLDDLLKEKLDMMNPERVDRELFLDTISQIESSGGTNFNHPEIESGIHEGQRAIGRFGLMPNTVKEVVTRAEREGTATPVMRGIASEGPVTMKQILEANPDLESDLAHRLAKKVLNKQQDPEKAAYSWFEGHNLSPEQVDQRQYQQSDYVKKFNKLREKLKKKD